MAPAIFEAIRHVPLTEPERSSAVNIAARAMQQSRAMRSSSILVALFAVACAACGARPTPAARVGSAEAATRAARASGAARLPDAALHLRLAEEQVTRARRLIEDGEHERAQWLLVRAEADAKLAQALAVEAQQRIAAEEVSTQARALAVANGEEAPR